jgi:PII-like signaling protein
MRTQGSAARLTILVDENDSWHHRPLYSEIIHRAHVEGLAGATAVRGIEGFAGAGNIHVPHLFRPGDHLPIVVTIIDDHDRIQAFLYRLDEILDKGMAMIDDVEVVRFHRDQPQRGGRRRHGGPVDSSTS